MNMNPDLPQEKRPQQVADALETQQRLLAEADAARQASQDAMANLEAAVERDRDARARALLEGGDEAPATAEQPRAELIAAQERAADVDRALTFAVEALRIAVVSSRDDWQRELAAVESDAVADYDQALAAFAEATERLKRVRGAQNFLRLSEREGGQLPGVQSVVRLPLPPGFRLSIADAGDVQQVLALLALVTHPDPGPIGHVGAGFPRGAGAGVTKVVTR